MQLWKSRAAAVRDLHVLDVREDRAQLLQVLHLRSAFLFGLQANARLRVTVLHPYVAHRQIT